MRDDNTTASQLRQWTTGALLACYIVPLVLLTIYNTTQLPLNKSWVVLTIGMLSALGGGTILFLLLRQWEGKLAPVEEDDEIFPENFPVSALEPSQEVRQEIEHLADLLTASQQQCETLGEELHREQRILEALKREKEKFEVQAMQFQHMLDSQKESSNEDLQGKETLIEEYQLTITDQRTVIEKKQQLITQLEVEIRDLRYELKTLVDISDQVACIPKKKCLNQ
jgi:hypothetical protein